MSGLWLGHFQEDLFLDLSYPQTFPAPACLKDTMGGGSRAGVLDQRKTFSVQGVGGPRLGSWEGADNLRSPGRGVSR